MEVLREFAAADSRGLRVVDLCERLQLGWPTVHRIVLCLVQEQMLMHAADPKRYRLGPAVFQLGLASTPHFSLRELCAEVLERLAQTLGDTVFLTTRSASSSVVVDRKEGSFEIKALPLDVGARRPLGVGAGGLAILAALPEKEARRIVELNADRLPAHSDLDARSLMAMVRDAQARGYALNQGHAFPDVTGIGLPIRTRAGVPIAAISVVGISARMTQERIAADLQRLRQEIEQLEARLASLDM
jgi:DNA-binding IclR family transcriptional regulator